MQEHIRKSSIGDFLEAFTNRMRTAREQNLDWKSAYASNKRWTDFMMGNILRPLAADLHYPESNCYATEYMLVDAGYFDGTKKQCHWDFDIALEHENNGCSWLEEFIKLLHINCGLRVIITYNKDNGSSGQGLFTEAEEIYDTRRYKDNKENWLILVGPSVKKLNQGDDYKAYTLKIGKEGKASLEAFPLNGKILQDD